jgi:hypothetical protein
MSAFRCVRPSIRLTHPAAIEIFFFWAYSLSRLPSFIFIFIFIFIIIIVVVIVVIIVIIIIIIIIIIIPLFFFFLPLPHSFWGVRLSLVGSGGSWPHGFASLSVVSRASVAALVTSLHRDEANRATLATDGLGKAGYGYLLDLGCLKLALGFASLLGLVHQSCRFWMTT